MNAIGRMLRDRAVLGAVSLLVLTGLFLLVVTYTPQKLLSPSGEEITATVRTSMQLQKGDPVRVHGVKAGEVTGLDLSPDGRSSIVRMKIYDDARPVYADASVWIRTRTLVGAIFAVDLDRGHPQAGELRGQIPMSRATAQTELEDVTQEIRGDARSGLRILPGELSSALRNHQAPKAALGLLSDTAPTIARGVRAVRGTYPGELRKVVRNTAATVRALDRPLALRGFVEGAGRALAVTARRSDDIRRTLASAQTALPNARTTLRELDGTLGRVDPLVADLRRPAGKVAPTLRLLNPTLSSARTLLADARPLMRELRPAARSLETAAKSGAPLVAGLDPILRRVDERILPDLALESPESQHTTYEMIGPTIAGLLGPFAFFDNETNFVRFLAAGGEKAVDSAPCTSFVTDPARRDEQLVTCAKAQRLLQSIFQPGSRALSLLRSKP